MEELDKYEQLKKKIDEAKTKSLVWSELKAFVELMVSMVDKSKKELSNLSVENIKVIKEGIAYLEDFQAKQANTLDSKINTATGSFDAQVASLKALIKKVKTIKPRDGVDGINPDPSDVVPLVLKELKLPEQKEVILDGRLEIVEKINSGEKKDLKIELKQIESMDKLEAGILNRATSILDSRTQFLINKVSNLQATVDAGGTGGASTLAEVSTGSTDTAKSLYTMTSGVDIQFKTSGDLTALYLKDSTGNVGIGTTAPDRKLGVVGQAIIDDSAQATWDRVPLTIKDANYTFGIGGPVMGTGYRMFASGGTLQFTSTGSTTFNTTGGAGGDVLKIGTLAGNMGGLSAKAFMYAATGDEVAYRLDYTTNKATSGNDTGLLINMTDTASPGLSLPLNIKVGSTSIFNINQIGAATFGNSVSANSFYSDNNTSTNFRFRGTGSGNPNLDINSDTVPANGSHNFIKMRNASAFPNTSGTVNFLSITPLYNQASGTSANTDLLINRTETSVGSGAQYLINAGTGGGTYVSKFSVSNTGQGYFAGNVGIGTTAPSNKLHVVGTDTQTSGTGAVGLSITPTYNQASGTAANTDLLINRTQTAVGSGAQNLIDAQVGGVSKFSVSNAGAVTATSVSCSPTISSGTSAPATTPTKVGDIFVDTTNKKMYIATGTTNSSDWTITN